MDNITDLLMLIITVVYVIATIFISKQNKKSADAAIEAVKESKRQFDENIKLQNQHNLDAVRPAVSIDFKSNHGNNFAGTITIMNHGLGPAIIKELKFFKDNKIYKNENGFCSMQDLLQLRLKEENEQRIVWEIFKNIYTKEFTYKDNDLDYLAVGEKLELLSFSIENTQEANLVERVFKGVFMELTYTDIYHSCEWKNEKNLSYFKANLID